MAVETCVLTVSDMRPPLVDTMAYLSLEPRAAAPAVGASAGASEPAAAAAVALRLDWSVPFRVLVLHARAHQPAGLGPCPHVSHVPAASFVT